jgi:hypothetical protein
MYHLVRLIAWIIALLIITLYGTYEVGLFISKILKTAIEAALKLED